MMCRQEGAEFKRRSETCPRGRCACLVAKPPITDIAFEHDSQNALVGSHANDPAIAARRLCCYCNVVDAPRGLWHAHVYNRGSIHQAERLSRLHGAIASTTRHTVLTSRWWKVPRTMRGSRTASRVNHGFEISYTLSTFTVTPLRHRNGRTSECRNGALFVLGQR